MHANSKSASLDSAYAGGRRTTTVFGEYMSTVHVSICETSAGQQAGHRAAARGASCSSSHDRRRRLTSTSPTLPATSVANIRTTYVRLWTRPSRNTYAVRVSKRTTASGRPSSTLLNRNHFRQHQTAVATPITSISGFGGQHQRRMSSQPHTISVIIIGSSSATDSIRIHIIIRIGAAAPTPAPRSAAMVTSAEQSTRARLLTVARPWAHGAVAAVTRTPRLAQASSAPRTRSHAQFAPHRHRCGGGGGARRRTLLSRLDVDRVQPHKHGWSRLAFKRLVNVRVVHDAKTPRLFGHLTQYHGAL